MASPRVVEGDEAGDDGSSMCLFLQSDDKEGKVTEVGDFAGLGPVCIPVPHHSATFSHLRNTVFLLC